MLLATLKTKGEMERSRQTEVKRESDGARERCCHSRREREREKEAVVGGDGWGERGGCVGVI